MEHILRLFILQKNTHICSFT